jgi:hypothetical protein
MVSSESPLYGCTLLMTLLLPGIDLLFHSFEGGDATIQALTRQDGQFNVHHIEPTAIFWGVVKL